MVLADRGFARHFEGRSKGIYVQIIERRDLEELDLPVPPLDVQQKIVEAAALAVEERVLRDGRGAEGAAGGGRAAGAARARTH
jgi:hypothetical protein